MDGLHVHDASNILTSKTVAAPLFRLRRVVGYVKSDDFALNRLRLTTGRGLRPLSPEGQPFERSSDKDVKFSSRFAASFQGEDGAGFRSSIIK